jgi:broad specificity phosphatase PhoE
MIRHGQSQTNKAGHLTGWYDAPLTEQGREDALFAKQMLAGLHFDKIYSSDLSRARDTAEIAVPGCQYTTTPMLREINVGTLAGKPPSAVKDSNGNALNKDGYTFFGGESIAQFRARIAEVVKMLEADAENCESVAAFCHGGFLRTFADIALEASFPRTRVQCKNCAVVIFEYNDSVWRLHSWINPL